MSTEVSGGAEVTGPGEWFTGFRRRLSEGEVGALPVILGLAVIWVVFQILNDNFLTPRNLTNLMLQMAALGTISIGMVLVLLLGEIDLSVGAVSGLCAGIMAVLNVKHGVAAPLAIAAAVLGGIAIGLFQGLWFTGFGIPSFVVTLAGLLAWQGALLLVLGSTGTINLFDVTIDNLTATFLPAAAGWAAGAAVVIIFAGSRFLGRRRAQSAGLTPRSVGADLTWTALVAVVVLFAVGVLNSDRGVPLAVLILLGFAVGFDYVVRRTRFGRYVLAVGGNAEAARRAGVTVRAIRVVVFGLMGMMAACGGVLAASRLLAVNQSSGAGDTLLNVIAAAVIGGTSLFGGRGSVWSAVTGALVIVSISNGMDLLALASPIKYVVTGGVLLAAVTIDAIARRGRQSAGRA